MRDEAVQITEAMEKCLKFDYVTLTMFICLAFLCKILLIFHFKTNENGTLITYFDIIKLSILIMCIFFSHSMFYWHTGTSFCKNIIYPRVLMIVTF